MHNYDMCHCACMHVPKGYQCLNDSRYMSPRPQIAALGCVKAVTRALASNTTCSNSFVHACSRVIT